LGPAADVIDVPTDVGFWGQSRLSSAIARCRLLTLWRHRPSVRCAVLEAPQRATFKIVSRPFPEPRVKARDAAIAGHHLLQAAGYGIRGIRGELASPGARPGLISSGVRGADG
jgi:hypothetical protein